MNLHLGYFLYSSILNKEENLGFSRLIEVFQIKNKENNITGCLLYCEETGHLIQYAEGPNQNIKVLLENIEKDTRHFNYDFILSGVSNNRIFSEWDMRIESNPLLFANIYKGLENNSEIRFYFKVFADLSNLNETISKV